MADGKQEQWIDTEELLAEVQIRPRVAVKVTRGVYEGAGLDFLRLTVWADIHTDKPFPVRSVKMSAREWTLAMTAVNSAVSQTHEFHRLRKSAAQRTEREGPEAEAEGSHPTK